jgi:hypothetical protein
MPNTLGFVVHGQVLMRNSTEQIFYFLWIEGKRPVSTVFPLRVNPVILEGWEAPGTLKS